MKKLKILQKVQFPLPFNPIMRKLRISCSEHIRNKILDDERKTRKRFITGQLNYIFIDKNCIDGFKTWNMLRYKSNSHLWIHRLFGGNVKYRCLYHLSSPKNVILQNMNVWVLDVVNFYNYVVNSAGHWVSYSLFFDSNRNITYNFFIRFLFKQMICLIWHFL